MLWLGFFLNAMMSDISRYTVMGVDFMPVLPLVTLSTCFSLLLLYLPSFNPPNPDFQES